jgi:hypothetical protein
MSIISSLESCNLLKTLTRESSYKSWDKAVSKFQTIQKKLTEESSYEDVYAIWNKFNEICHNAAEKNKNLENKYGILDTKIKQNQNSTLGKVLNIFYRFLLSYAQKKQNEFTHILEILKKIKKKVETPKYKHTLESNLAILTSLSFENIDRTKSFAEHLLRIGFRTIEKDSLLPSEYAYFNEKVLDFLKSKPGYHLNLVKYGYDVGSPSDAPITNLEEIEIKFAENLHILNEDEIREFLSNMKLNLHLSPELFNDLVDKLNKKKIAFEHDLSSDRRELDKKALILALNEAFDYTITFYVSDLDSPDSFCSKYFDAKAISYEWNQTRAFALVENIYGWKNDDELAKLLVDFIILSKPDIKSYAHLLSQEDTKRLNILIAQFSSNLVSKSPKLSLIDHLSSAKKSINKAKTQTALDILNKISNWSEATTPGYLLRNLHKLVNSSPKEDNYYTLFQSMNLNSILSPQKQNELISSLLEIGFFPFEDGTYFYELATSLKSIILNYLYQNFYNESNTHERALIEAAQQNPDLDWKALTESLIPTVEEPIASRMTMEEFLAQPKVQRFDFSTFVDAQPA